MSYTIMSNPITTGTRRLVSLGVYGVPTLVLGAALSDLAQGMINEGGFNQVAIQTAVDAGASDAQLQAVWDNYNGNDPNAYRAINALVASLSPTSILQNPTVSATIDAAGAAYNAAAAAGNFVISAAGQAWDLAGQATWDSISALLSNTRNQIASVAQMAPKDPDVIQHVNDFNAKLNQFASYYQTIWGHPPSSVLQVTLGVAQFVIPAAVLAGVAIIIAAAYSYGQWAETKRAQLLAQTQQALLSAGATPGQIASITSGAPVNWTAWLQQSMPVLIFGLAALVVVPPLLTGRGRR